MHIPSLKSLLYLVKLHEHKHFGLAAKACFVSQPTLSAGISRLEDSLGTRLIERDNKHLLFTPTAEEFVKRAKSILAQVEDLTQFIESSGKPFGGILHLGIIPTIAPFLLPQFLLLMKQLLPEVQVFIREEKSATILEQLKQGELDLVILALPYPAPGNIIMKSFYRDYFFFAWHKDSQYIGNNEKVVYEDLEDEAILLLEDGHCLRDHALDACNLQNVSKINTFSVTSLHTLVHMINNDLGVSFLPEIAINSGILQNTDIRCSKLEMQEDLPSSTNYRELGFAWRERSTYQQEFTVLYQNIQQRIPYFFNKKTVLNEP